MPTRLRRLVLTAHVVASVGWLGAATTFVAIAVVAMTSQAEPAVRGALLLMEPIGWYVLLPLAVTSLVTGIVQALGSVWGLIRHYWVLFKLVIGAVSTYVLLMFNLTTVGPVTRGAADPATPVDRLRMLAGTPRDHALVALAGLLVATVLAVYKPRAVTRYGRRPLNKRRDTRSVEVPAPALAAMTAATGDGTSEPAGLTTQSDAAPDPGVSGASSTGRLARRAKAVGFTLGVLAWALLVRLVLGTGDTGGHDPSTGPGGDTPTVSRGQQLNPDVGTSHAPPPGIPDHDGG
jgi:hypothetical protein